MLIKSGEYDIPALALSDSSLNNLNCNRKLELRKFYGHARNEHEDTLATGAGHALHGAWQQWMATGDVNAGIWALIKRFPHRLQASENDPRGIQACYTSFLAMIDNPLAARYELATVMHAGKQMPAVEVPFRITFADLSIFPDRHVPIYYDGFIDAILWDTLLQRFVVLDIKTTRKWRNDYSLSFANDEQCLPYAFVLEKALDQPANSLSVIYLVVYIDPLQPVARQYEFEKSQADIQQWALKTAFQIREKQQMAAIGFFPKNGKACDTFGPCQYAEVCSYSDPKSIREYLDMQFGPRDDTQVTDFKPWFELSLTIEGLV